MDLPNRWFSSLAIGSILAAPLASMAGEEAHRPRSFELTYRATVEGIPDGAKVLELWLPLPQSDPNQAIHRVRVGGPGPVTIGREPRSGNQSVHFKVEAPRSPVVATLVIEAIRRENPGRDEPLGDLERVEFLKPEPLVPLDGPVKALALEASRGSTSDLDKARAIYEKVAGMMRYDKGGTGWGRGDALFACDVKRGNCTDFHALVIGMARSVGIPARFAIGLPLPEARGEGEISGYHCWAELYVDGRGWVPVDASEAAKDPSKRDYFFGHHDENRLEFSRGRQVTLAPAQQGPPLNFFIDPHAEVDGKTHATVARKFTFRDVDRAGRPADPAHIR